MILFRRPGWLVLLAAGWLTACGSSSSSPPAPAFDPARLDSQFARIRDLSAGVQDGDIIFRNGNDEVSRAARSMNRLDTSFSHAGLVFRENDSVVVYHAIGGIYNPGQRLRRDPIDSFGNPRENNSLGLFRFPLKPGELDSLRAVVGRHYRQGLKFDLYFNFRSDDVMYCSEFVFKSLNQALGGRMSSYVRMDTLPFGVTLDDIFLHPDCRPVKKAVFLP